MRPRLNRKGAGGWRTLAVCLSALGAVASSGLTPIAQAAPAAEAGAQRPAWRPESFSLANGMQVIVLPDHRAPVVTHMVWYKVGRADEKPGKSGIAHLFEHLMFKATDKIEAGEFSKLVARMGGDDNAFTNQDYTGYYERVAKQRLADVMQLEADRMTRLVLTDDQVLPERDVVTEERRQRTENNPGSLLYEKVAAAIYGDHPYAIPVVGFMNEVTALTREDALEFYRNWYGPENAILVVAGDVTAAELKPLAERIYGVISPKGDLKVRAWPAVKPLAKSVTVTHADAKVRQPSWSRYWLGVAGGDPRSEGLEVAMEILGGGRTSRLQRELVEGQAIAVDVYAYADTDSLAPGMISIGATPANGVSLAKVEREAEAVLERFALSGPTPEELARAKSSLAAQAIFARDNQMGMAQWFGGLAVRGRTIDDIVGWESRIRAVTREDVMRAIRTLVAAKPFVDAQLLEARP